MKKVVKFPDKRQVAEEAAEWLIRLDSEHPTTGDELKALSDWLARSPVHREELGRLASLWNRMNIMTELAVPVAKGGSNGSARFRAEEVNRPRNRRWNHVAWGLMATVAITMAAVFLVRENSSLPTESGVYETRIGQQSTVSLSDGSSVVLNTNSRINVDYDNRYRNVYLSQGEALFTVAKVADIPFRVYAGSGRIEALGTAFSVRLDEEAVKITVTEGRVSLASATKRHPGGVERTTEAGSDSGGSKPAVPGLIGDAFRTVGRLGAGQVATMYTTGEMAASGERTAPAIESVTSEELAQQLAWSDGVLLFSGDTLDDVVKELGRYTSITIEIPDAELRNMRVGGRFPLGETEAMLGALEANFELHIKRPNRDRVILTSARE